MLWRLALGRKSVASGILSRASAVMTKLSDAQPRAQRPRLGPLLTPSQRTVPPSLCFVRVEPDACYSEDLRGRIDRPSQQRHHHLRSHRDELFTVSLAILYAGTVRLLSLLVEPIVGHTSEQCLSSTDRRLHTATGGDEPSTLAIASQRTLPRCPSDLYSISDPKRSKSETASAAAVSYIQSNPLCQVSTGQ